MSAQLQAAPLFGSGAAATRKVGAGVPRPAV